MGRGNPVVTPVAAGICFIAGGRVLLMRRAGNPHKGTWAYPGGKIETDETPEQAARREVREECGYDYTGPLLPLGTNQNGFQGFAAKVEPFAPEINEEHDAVQWASFDKLPSPLLPGMLQQSTPMAQDARDPLLALLALVTRITG
jgi:ADP-ribose pyrophosphatase YjhB (NUDIX family)